MANGADTTGARKRRGLHQRSPDLVTATLNALPEL